MRRTLRVAVPLAALTLIAAVAVAGKGPRPVDAIVLSPEFAGANVRSIAMLPVVSYTHDVQVEKLVAGLWGQSFRESGYRWVSAPTARDMLMAGGSDSLLKSVREALLKSPRVDSAQAGPLCARFRTHALLAVRVDRWDQNQIEWNQSGRPSTTVQLTAALVDSAGRLLWSAAGSETVQGPFHDPSTNPIGVTSGGLSTQPITGEGGPPAYDDVLRRILARWVEQFPKAVIAAPAK
ncbi:MAG: hypothetical protein HZC42_13435 [Candidatus Eisenbacteria bacterium]|nr:hypothetical protein [Candidatus Eisenbacteria bacterium]